MTANIKLDQTDRKILKILQSNGKITNARLSEQIGLSPAPTLERVKKLENSGIIKMISGLLSADLQQLLPMAGFFLQNAFCGKTPQG